MPANNTRITSSKGHLLQSIKLQLRSYLGLVNLCNKYQSCIAIMLTPRHSHVPAWGCTAALRWDMCQKHCINTTMLDFHYREHLSHRCCLHPSANMVRPSAVQDPPLWATELASRRFQDYLKPDFSTMNEVSSEQGRTIAVLSSAQVIATQNISRHYHWHEGSS